MRQRVGLGTREESGDELLLWEEKRMMGGLRQQAWEGEQDGDEGSRTKRTDGYATMFGFLMNISLPAGWLLRCYCWQEKCGTHTHKYTHKKFFCSSCKGTHNTFSSVMKCESSIQAWIYRRADVSVSLCICILVKSTSTFLHVRVSVSISMCD